MLEKPDLQEEKMIACLQDEYDLHIVQVIFLPLGVDRDTVVYRVTADDETPYFVKLRRGVFDETSVALPKFLSDLGIQQIIAPLETTSGILWAKLELYRLILYPYIEGHNGFEVDLTDNHWIEFGETLKKIHTAVIPPELTRDIQQETYSPKWREIVKMFLKGVEVDAVGDPVAGKLTAFLQTKREQIFDLVGRAERLSLVLKASSPDLVVCHSDVHAANLLIDPNDLLFIVDWDNPILAPKERDLIFIGGGLGGAGHTQKEEEILFFQGYGQTEIDPITLAYFRYERIIQDIAVFCDRIFLMTESEKDRERSLGYLKSNFLPNNVLEIAYKTDKTWNGV